MYANIFCDAGQVRGVQLFPGGSNCLFPIETHITCDFPGGSGGGGPTFSRGVQLLIPYRNPYNL